MGNVLNSFKKLWLVLKHQLGTTFGTIKIRIPIYLCRLIFGVANDLLWLKLITAIFYVIFTNVLIFDDDRNIVLIIYYHILYVYIIQVVKS